MSSRKFLRRCLRSRFALVMLGLAFVVSVVCVRAYAKGDAVGRPGVVRTWAFLMIVLFGVFVSGLAVKWLQFRHDLLVAETEARAEGLWVGIYADGGVRVGAPQAHARVPRQLACWELNDWMQSAAANGWTVTVTCRPTEAMVGPVLASLQASAVSFVLVEEDPPRLLKGTWWTRCADLLRRPSSLARACRAGVLYPVVDMLERGADREEGGRALRWARKFGQVPVVGAYQRITGARSRNAPVGTQSAVLVPVVTSRVALGTLSGITLVLLAWLVLAFPAPLMAWVLWICVPFALTVWTWRNYRSMISEFALEGWNLWWRRPWQGWHGPADLRQVEGFDVRAVRGGGMAVGTSMSFVLVGDAFEQNLPRGAQKSVRTWVGGRPSLMFSLYFGLNFPRGMGVVTAIREQLPADVPTGPDNEVALEFYDRAVYARLIDD